MPLGLSAVNIVLRSVDEVEASWPRPEESGRAWVGKVQYRGGPAMPASLCGLAMACEMTSRVTKGPGAFFPLWPVKAHQLVALSLKQTER